MASERILILRPQPQAARTAAMLVSAGYEPVLYPVMRYVESSDRVIDTTGFNHILFSSAAAVHLYEGRLGQKLPAICVGPVTAAAIAAGFEVRMSGHDGLSGLAQHLPFGPILHLCGADHLTLSADNVVRKVVYSAEPLPLAPFPKDLSALLVHSRRSGELLLLAHKPAKTLPVVAISARAAEPFEGYPVTIAAEPHDTALLAALKLALATGAG